MEIKLEGYKGWISPAGIFIPCMSSKIGELAFRIYDSFYGHCWMEYSSQDFLLNKKWIVVECGNAYGRFSFSDEQKICIHNLRKQLL